MRKFWRKDETSAVIAISETKIGEEKASELNYSRVSIADMTSYQRKCLRDYDQNNPTVFPAQYLG